MSLKGEPCRNSEMNDSEGVSCQDLNRVFIFCEKKEINYYSSVRKFGYILPVFIKNILQFQENVGTKEILWNCYVNFDDHH